MTAKPDRAVEDNPHKDHRKRLRKRFLTEELYSFEDHQILELLLFFALPRIDTNELGHRLLQRFKTLAGVFNAEYADLLEVDGMGENSATLIHMIPQLTRAYLLSADDAKKRFSSLREIGRFFERYFLSMKSETAVGLYLNSNMELLHIERFSVGTDLKTGLSIRKVVDLMIRTNASHFVLAHNHPDGNLNKSSEDAEVTAQLGAVLSGIETTFLEHFIVGNGEYRMLLHPNLSVDSPFDSGEGSLRDRAAEKM